jgi:hypothetical protein
LRGIGSDTQKMEQGAKTPVGLVCAKLFTVSNCLACLNQPTMSELVMKWAETSEIPHVMRDVTGVAVDASSGLSGGALGVITELLVPIYLLRWRSYVTAPFSHPSWLSRGHLLASLNTKSSSQSRPNTQYSRGNTQLEREAPATADGAKER